MDKPIPLVLGGIAIEQYVGPIRQRYEPMGGSTELRLSAGAGVKMTHWTRTTTSISGTGNLDPGFDQLDYSGPLELLCVKPRAMNGTVPVFALPPAAKRRSDVLPWGWALVDGQWRDTAARLVGDSVQLSPVNGAQAYRVFWYPRLVVFTDGIVSEFDEGTGLYDWSLEAREV